MPKVFHSPNGLDGLARNFTKEATKVDWQNYVLQTSWDRYFNGCARYLHCTDWLRHFKLIVWVFGNFAKSKSNIMARERKRKRRAQSTSFFPLCGMAYRIINNVQWPQNCRLWLPWLLFNIEFMARLMVLRQPQNLFYFSLYFL